MIQSLFSRNPAGVYSSQKLISNPSATQTGHTPAHCRSLSCTASSWTRAVRWAVHATAVDHLVLHVDGFNATKAAEVYGQLPKLDLDEFTLSNFGIVQSRVPARIQGQLFTNHPQLLQADMQAWLDFLQSFGFQENQIADILRTSPDVFYTSNIFQVCHCNGWCNWSVHD